MNVIQMTVLDSDGFLGEWFRDDLGCLWESIEGSCMSNFLKFEIFVLIFKHWQRFNRGFSSCNHLVTELICGMDDELADCENSAILDLVS